MRPAPLFALLLVVGCQSIRLGTALGPEVPPATAPAPPLDVAWEQDVQAGFGPESALLTADRLVVGTRQGEVVVLDLSDGSVVGSASFGDAVEGRPDLSAAGDVLYVPIDKGGAGVVAVDLETGSPVWSWRDGPVSGLRRVGSVVVALTRDGQRVGLDAASGDELWRAAADSTAQYQALPVPLADGVVLADDRGHVRRIDVASGEAVWTAEVGAPVYHAPAVADGVVLVPTTRGRLVALDATTGRERWRVEVDPDVRLTAPAVAGGAVAVGATDGTVLVLDLATGRERWRQVLDGAVSARPLWAGRVVYVGTLSSRVLALDAATGETVWSAQSRGRVRSALLAADGLLLAFVEPRHVVAYRPALPTAP